MRIVGEGLGEQPAAVLIDLGDDLLQRPLGRGQVVELRLQSGGPRFQLAQLLEGLEVDAAQPAQLAPQLGDLLVGGVNV